MKPPQAVNQVMVGVVVSAYTSYASTTQTVEDLEKRRQWLSMVQFFRLLGSGRL
jgi:hypothetical protein